MLSNVVTALAFAAGAGAATFKRGGSCSCSFHLTTSGNVNFPVGEDSVGEVLGGSQLTQASFCLNGDTIYDANGNPCWFTPPTYVFQCDQGATPSTGFSIGCNGEVSFNGQTTFYECQNGIGDEVNIYSMPNEGEVCGSITFTADNCRAQCTTTTSCAVPSTVTVTVLETATVSVCEITSSPPPVHTTTTTTSTAPASTCPMELPSGYQFPHLIVPIDSSSPSTAGGTSFFGEVSSTVSSIFNFDIPFGASGDCTLWFLFPTQAQLVTSSFTLSGPGTVDFASLSGVATESTSFSTVPSISSDLGQFTLAPGNAYKISTFSCPAGTTVSYEMSSVGGTAFRYFQDFNECPIGLYIVPS